MSGKGGERMLSITFFRLVALFSAVLIVCEIALISWRIVPMIYGQTAVPLHFNTHFGVDTVGAWWRIYTVPAVALILLVGNMFLANYFFHRERVLAYMAVGATLILETVLFGAMIFIVLLNISYG